MMTIMITMMDCDDEDDDSVMTMMIAAYQEALALEWIDS